WYFNYYKNDGEAIDFGNEANGTLPLALQEPNFEIKDLPEVELITISGTKTWEGNGVKPDSITVNLLQGTEVFKSQVVKPVDGVWSYDFENVPVTDEDWNEYVYEIKEIEVPGFTTTYNGFNIINTTIVPVIKGTIEFLKHDGEGRVLEGAAFNLYAAEDTTFETAIATAISNANGEVIFTDVAEGNYKIKESAAPVGYLKSETVLEASITVNGATVTPLGGPVINEEITADVIVTKVGENEDPLSGAEFTLYKDDVKVGEAEVTGTDGMAIFENIPYGTYTVKETKAPAGYVLSEDVEDVVVEDVENVKITFFNTKIMGTVKITKVDEADHGKVLAGAKFSIVDNNTKIEVYTGTTDENGMLEKELTFGEYTISEVSAPEGYDKTEDTWPITIDEDGEIIPLTIENVMTEIEDVDPLPVEDEEGTLKITKVDAENSEKVLEGAKFKIVHNAEKTVYERTTNENGILEIKLPLGEYTISEVEPPKDYEKTDKTWTANLLEKDKTVALVITNKMIEVEVVDPLPTEDEMGTLKIKKVDKETGAALAGVKFRITDKDGDVVFEGLTDVNGMIEEELLVGDYTITELEELPGYVASDKPETAKIKTDGEVVELTITNKKMYGLLSIKKVDAETGDVLEGAKFRIVDKDGIEILEDVTDEEGMLEVWLPKGEYIISETEAPEDYIATEETWSVKVTADAQVFNLVVENEMIEVEEVSPETLPQTGGIPSESLYILGAFAIFTGLQLTRKRRTV
ncbi:MAG TPA: SpaA isopeptide-forming pilin-related protein, partial [Clostridiaceae bacterium]|nr:SpaA isopeptide-forming pilin-related protein [Clostridiaceae bacterium]